MKRGRTSAAELVSVRVDGQPPPLDPPACLSKDERALFEEIVSACSTRHFVASDAPLLVGYVQAIALARNAIGKAATNTEALQTWEKATRMMATLATRLRLAPQARIDPKTLGRMQAPKTRPPWEHD